MRGSNRAIFHTFFLLLQKYFKAPIYGFWFAYCMKQNNSPDVLSADSVTAVFYWSSLMFCFKFI